jgi:hypothetical protein
MVPFDGLRHTPVNFLQSTVVPQEPERDISLQCMLQLLGPCAVMQELLALPTGLLELLAA